jgi:uncharacterized lipoprotein YddW (UPF0748 family)
MKILGLALSVIAAGLFTLSSCKKASAPDGTEPEVTTPEVNDTLRMKEAVAWIDARSNVFGSYGRFLDTGQIRATLDTMKQVGITGIVLDVKGSSGHTMYDSQYADNAFVKEGKHLPAGVDYVGFMIAEAKKRKMKVFCSMVTFVEGDRVRRQGKVYDDPVFKDQYQSIVCDIAGNRVPITSTDRNGFVNPAIPAVQDRAMNIIKEIVSKYNPDGFLMDYARYADAYADFSDYSKNDFIKFLETKYNDNDAKNMKFPSDIVSSWKQNGDAIVPNATGKYFKRWLIYRSTVIRDFFSKARTAVKSVNSNVKFGTYVGAWYATYYQVGVNWASQDYDPFNDREIRFDWAYPDYEKTGYAEQLDLLMTGNYFTQLYIDDNPATTGMKYHWWSVEGSLKGAKYVTRNKMPLYGSLDMGNLSWPDEKSVTNTIKYLRNNSTAGVMLFDIIHVYAPQANRLKKPLWNAIREGLKD